MRPLTLLLLLLLSATPTLDLLAQEPMCMRIMTYNVENLFDLRHDSLKDDTDYLPGGDLQWSVRRYHRKLDNIARVIIAVGEGIPPALIALCEVENDSVMLDLTQRSPLRTLGYRYLMTNSPDRRGIDVALLYQPALFKPLHHQSIRIAPPRSREHPTRDILHVCGLLPRADTIDILVCHLPSKAGNTTSNGRYRKKVAQVLKHTADSLARLRQTPRLLIMGDMNCELKSPSLKLLRVGLPPTEGGDPHPHSLYDLLGRQALSRKQGTYKYQGEWQSLDHIIVSGNLLRPDAGWHTSEAQARIFSAPFLLAKSGPYSDSVPLRTYKGKYYQGGFSDHLPIYTDLLKSY